MSNFNKLYLTLLIVLQFAALGSFRSFSAHIMRL